MRGSLRLGAAPYIILGAIMYKTLEFPTAASKLPAVQRELLKSRNTGEIEENGEKSKLDEDGDIDGLVKVLDLLQVNYDLSTNENETGITSETTQVRFINGQKDVKTCGYEDSIVSESAKRWMDLLDKGDTAALRVELANAVIKVEPMIEAKHRFYHCVWGEGYVYPQKLTVDISHFSEDNGYHIDVINRVLSLEPGQEIDLTDISGIHTVERSV
jgi:hypothetical protein